LVHGDFALLDQLGNDAKVGGAPGNALHQRRQHKVLGDVQPAEKRLQQLLQQVDSPGALQQPDDG